MENNFDLLRILTTNTMKGSPNSNTQSMTPVAQCQFFDFKGYVTQAMLAIFSFSVLLCNISLKLNILLLTILS